ncbi:MAG: AAA family ATPase [Armatimonadota bacterium]
MPVSLSAVQEKSDAVIREVEKVIVGKTDTVRLALAALLAGGHVLIEDIPGVGKTMLARSLSRALGCSFRRIQFTPDLLPADITGTPVYSQRTGEFEFRKGPIFANVVLADEVNRGTPKTQSALLECMEEAQVSADGVTYPLPKPFFVIATENNVELQGTFPLPEAQLDRFWMRLSLGYPEREHEVAILDRQEIHHPVLDLEPVLDKEEVLEMQSAVRRVYIDRKVKQYVVDIVSATRHHRYVSLAASPRGSLCLMHVGKALAAMEGRGYVLPDHVKRLVPVVLSHRLVLNREARLNGVTSAEVVRDILDTTSVPSLA